MTGTVHILTGAALGSLARNRRQAVFGGWLSHVVLDSLPHRDLNLKGELVLLSLAALLLWRRCRFNDKALIGAVSAAAPDFENGLCRLGVIDRSAMKYPSHSGFVPHGPKASTAAVQVGIAIMALWILRSKGIIRV